MYARLFAADRNCARVPVVHVVSTSEIESLDSRTTEMALWFLAQTNCSWKESKCDGDVFGSQTHAPTPKVQGQDFRKEQYANTSQTSLHMFRIRKENALDQASRNS